METLSHIKKENILTKSSAYGDGYTGSLLLLFFFCCFFCHCYKGDNFCDFQFASEVPFGKGSALRGKNLLPPGANSFLIEQVPFQKGAKTIFTELSPFLRREFKQF